jgi:plastocyanin
MCDERRGTMRSTKLVAILALLMAIGLVAGACSKKSPTTTGGSTTPTTEASSPDASPSETESEGGQITIGSDSANDHGTKDVTGESSVEVELDNFYFEPTAIKGTAGAQIKLELKNEATVVHNFSLTDQKVDQDVQPDQSVDVTVTIPQSGFVEFFCKYHKATGMVGELTS